LGWADGGSFTSERDLVAFALRFSVVEDVWLKYHLACVANIYNKVVRHTNPLR
jgi:hypothetical protein